MSLPMRRWASVAAAAGGLAVVVAAGGLGCALVMDLSTSGYRLADAAAGEGATSGPCDGADSCTGLFLACTSASNCDGGICCLETTNFSVVQAVCQPGPTCTSSGFAVQACQTTAECDGAACTSQTCSIDGVAVTFSACSVVPTCTAQ